MRPDITYTLENINDGLSMIKTIGRYEWYGWSSKDNEWHRRYVPPLGEKIFESNSLDEFNSRLTSLEVGTQVTE